MLCNNMIYIPMKNRGEGCNNNRQGPRNGFILSGPHSFSPFESAISQKNLLNNTLKLGGAHALVPQRFSGA